MRISDWSSDVCSSDLRVNALTYKDRKSEKSETVELEGVFVQIGLLPNSEWLKDSVKLSPRGEIEVDARGQTSVPGVFAAGDVTTVPYKQIVIAMGEGSKAALSAFDHLIRTRSEEHTSELQSLMRISYAVFCLKKKNINIIQ